MEMVAAYDLSAVVVAGLATALTEMVKKALLCSVVILVRPGTLAQLGFVFIVKFVSIFGLHLGATRQLTRRILLSNYLECNEKPGSCCRRPYLRKKGHQPLVCWWSTPISQNQSAATSHGAYSEPCTSCSYPRPPRAARQQEIRKATGSTTPHQRSSVVCGRVLFYKYFP